MASSVKFREDQYEEESELILAMKEIRQRKRELKITQNEWFTVWMLSRMKRERMLIAMNFSLSKT